MNTSPAVNQFAWLFTRGEQSVRLQIEEQGDGFKLTINGPGMAQAVHQFADMTALMLFVTSYQDRLRGDNFRLQANAERRTRQSQRPDGGPERRRA